MKTTADDIRSARLEAGLSIEQLAEQAGVNAFTLARFEDGTRTVPSRWSDHVLATASGGMKGRRIGQRPSPADSPFAMSLADTVRAELARRRLTPRDLGARLDMGSAAIHRRLSGKVAFTVTEFQIIADFFALCPSGLLALIPQQPEGQSA